MTAITDEQTSYLARLLAVESAENLRVIDRGEITAGWETRIHAFAIRYVVEGEERGEELVLRLFPGVEGAVRAVKEFTVMRHVARRGVPTPRVDFVVTEKTPFGDPFIVMERIEGSNMADVLDDAPDNEVLRLVEAMVNPLVRLHAIPPNELFPARPRAMADDAPIQFVPPDLADMRVAVDRYRLHDFDLLLRWLEVRRKEVAPGYTCVLHNDYHPLNIVVREADGELIILDWSFAEVGDFRLDLAWSALLLGVMAGKRYREVLIERYQKISGRRVNNFSYFEVLKLTARLITIAVWLDPSVVIPVSGITKQAIRNEYKVHVLNVYDRVKEITELRVPVFESL